MQSNSAHALVECDSPTECHPSPVERNVPSRRRKKESRKKNSINRFLQRRSSAASAELGKTVHRRFEAPEVELKPLLSSGCSCRLVRESGCISTAPSCGTVNGAFAVQPGISRVWQQLRSFDFAGGSRRVVNSVGQNEEKGGSAGSSNEHATGVLPSHQATQWVRQCGETDPHAPCRYPMPMDDGESRSWSPGQPIWCARTIQRLYERSRLSQPSSRRRSQADVPRRTGFTRDCAYRRPAASRWSAQPTWEMRDEAKARRVGSRRSG